MKLLIKGIIPSKYKYRLPANVLQILGELPSTSIYAEEGDYSKRYDKSHWAFMLDAPFNVSSRCCDVMKKAPLTKYCKESGRYPITAQMTEESALRQSQWLSHGCNIYEGRHIISNPMSFWTEQDVLRYIVENKLKLASVYGSIVPDNGENNFDGQVSFSDLGLTSDTRPLKTTGCSRTGCMFCGYGCHLEKNPNRFERMKETHPKLYEYLFRDWDKGGLGYKSVIDWINENSKWNIKY